MITDPPYECPTTTGATPNPSTASCTTRVSSRNDPRCNSGTTTSTPTRRNPAATTPKCPAW